MHEPPSKYVASEIEIQLACRLLFIDMEGLNDGRAVKTIVPQVNPRKMVRKMSPVAAIGLNTISVDFSARLHGCGNSTY